MIARTARRTKMDLSRMRAGNELPEDRGQGKQVALAFPLPRHAEKVTRSRS